MNYTATITTLISSNNNNTENNDVLDVDNNNNNNNNNIDTDTDSTDIEMFNKMPNEYAKHNQRCRLDLQVRGWRDIDKRSNILQCVVCRSLQQQILEEHYYDHGSTTTTTAAAEEAKMFILPPNIMHDCRALNDQQLRNWNGLRWQRFCETKSGSKKFVEYHEWLRRSKCWQDQNLHKILAPMFARILLHLHQFCETLATSRKYGSGGKMAADVFAKVLFFKCFADVFASRLQFERTRKTPLVPQSVIKNGKPLKDVLINIHAGFTINKWLITAQLAKQKLSVSLNTNIRGGLAKCLLQMCVEFATIAHLEYRTLFRRLKNIDNDDVSGDELKEVNKNIDKKCGQLFTEPFFVEHFLAKNNNNSNNSNNNNNNVYDETTTSNSNSISCKNDYYNYNNKSYEKNNNNNYSRCRPSIDYGPDRGLPSHLITSRLRSNPMGLRQAFNPTINCLPIECSSLRRTFSDLVLENQVLYQSLDIMAAKCARAIIQKNQVQSCLRSYHQNLGPPTFASSLPAVPALPALFPAVVLSSVPPLPSLPSLPPISPPKNTRFMHVPQLPPLLSIPPKNLLNVNMNMNVKNKEQQRTIENPAIFEIPVEIEGVALFLMLSNPQQNPPKTT